MGCGLCSVVYVVCILYMVYMSIYDVTQYCDVCGVWCMWGVGVCCGMAYVVCVWDMCGVVDGVHVPTPWQPAAGQNKYEPSSYIKTSGKQSWCNVGQYSSSSPSGTRLRLHRVLSAVLAHIGLRLFKGTRKAVPGPASSRLCAG